MPKETLVVETNRIIWPQRRGEQELPPIDGVLALYDSTSPKSILEISRILRKCSLWCNLLASNIVVLGSGRLFLGTKNPMLCFVSISTSTVPGYYSFSLLKVSNFSRCHVPVYCAF
jgi:hypothetical protein